MVIDELSIILKMNEFLANLNLNTRDLTKKKKIQSLENTFI